jgi:AI-2 transport protein TqsA
MAAEPPPPGIEPARPTVAAAAVARALVAAAAAWFLLGQLTLVVRPLLTAAFLAYVLMPYHVRLRRHVGTSASLGLLAGATAVAVVLLGLVVYSSALGLSDDLPRLQGRAAELFREAEHLAGADPETARRDASQLADLLYAGARRLAVAAADALVEAVVVAMYLLFLLVEGSRFPDRVRRAYSPGRAEEILAVAGQVSASIVHYLRAKVRASLLLAVPAGLVLWACGVRFAPLWAVLTFLCNFIPYLGPVLAYGLPVGFAFLWFGPAAEAWTAAALLLTLHTLSAAVVEPVIVGNAVGLSPLVLLVALGFWGLLWGIPGMFLAVPLTAVAVIVMGHFASTRPVARLLRGG